MFYLIPLTGSRRQMTYRYAQTYLIYQLLKFKFPQFDAITITTSTISNNQQFNCFGIACLPHQIPPSPYAFNGKGSRIVINANAYPSGVLRQVINTVRGNAFFPKVMDLYLFRVSFRPPFTSTILVFADKFFFLCIDRNNRLMSRLKINYRLINMFKLSVSVRMRSAFKSFFVGLQTILQLAQQFGNQIVACLVSHILQFIRNLSYAFTRPSQWRFWISTSNWFHKIFNVFHKRWVFVRTPFASATLLADTLCIVSKMRIPKLFLSRGDCSPRNAYCSSNQRNTAVTQRRCFCCSENPPESFIKEWFQKIKTLFYRFFFHAVNI